MISKEVQMPIRGVFFDLYGTLLIYGDMKAAWTAWLATFYRCLKPHRLALPQEVFAARCDRFFGKQEPPAQAYGSTVFERRIHTLCGELNLHVPSEDIAHIANTIAGVWQHYIALDPECHPLLQALQPQKSLALVSNFDHPPHVYKVLTELGLGTLFNVIIISGEVGVKKPDPRIFQIALERTGLRPDEVVYVGDTDEDVNGARAAAIFPIVIKRDFKDRDRQVLDFQAGSRNQQASSLTSVPTEARTITKLSDLLKIVV
jgi:HAD superfamily hydrolase (TIGR01549 family)